MTSTYINIFYLNASDSPVLRLPLELGNGIYRYWFSRYITGVEFEASHRRHEWYRLKLSSAAAPPGVAIRCAAIKRRRLQILKTCRHVYAEIEAHLLPFSPSQSRCDDPEDIGDWAADSPAVTSMRYFHSAD